MEVRLELVSGRHQGEARHPGVTGPACRMRPQDRWLGLGGVAQARRAEMWRPTEPVHQPHTRGSASGGRAPSPRPEAATGLWGCGSCWALRGWLRPPITPSLHVALARSLGRPATCPDTCHVAPTSPALALPSGPCRCPRALPPHHGAVCGKGSAREPSVPARERELMGSVSCCWPDKMLPRIWHVPSVHGGGALHALSCRQYLALQTPLRTQNPQPDLCSRSSPGSR